MGWDAFGLPAENAAIERSIHPNEWTTKNIGIMKTQMEKILADFDWDRVRRPLDPMLSCYACPRNRLGCRRELYLHCMFYFMI